MPKRLSLEIAVLLGAKLVALTVLYYVFFSPTAQPRADADATAAQLLTAVLQR